VRPDSKIERLYELRDVPVGICLMAGSHFTTLKTLGEVLPKEHIEILHTGGPGQRLLALLDGEVEAANLLDPEIPIAEAKGLRKLAQGEFVITFWVSPTIKQETLGKFFGALKRAEEVLEQGTSKYSHLWEQNETPLMLPPRKAPARSRSSVCRTVCPSRSRPGRGPARSARYQR
jgi:NitT/TauT family transport system substrate-binding protein